MEVWKHSAAMVLFELNTDKRITVTSQDWLMNVLNCLTNNICHKASPSRFFSANTDMIIPVSLDTSSGGGGGKKKKDFVSKIDQDCFNMEFVFFLVFLQIQLKSGLRIP